ncbi:ATP-binding protein [Qipengyuania flava]|uniref:ATP-binding protein n=1 Tax=Qipengyuania flava TaxID=192812 RepID=UPI00273FB1DA|nr:ATP-binding protein [Qipengyuania flava]
MVFDEADRIATIRLEQDRDVVKARSRVAQAMKACGSSELMQTRFVTAVSEIVRNALNHAGGGTLAIYAMPGRRLVGVECSDNGRGIEDINAAMRDGFTTRLGSLGRGLGGAKRLSKAFTIESSPGIGTTVRMIGACSLR